MYGWMEEQAGSGISSTGGCQSGRSTAWSLPHPLQAPFLHDPKAFAQHVLQFLDASKAEVRCTRCSTQGAHPGLSTDSRLQALTQLRICLHHAAGQTAPPRAGGFCPSWLLFGILAMGQALSGASCAHERWCRVEWQPACACRMCPVTPLDPPHALHMSPAGEAHAIPTPELCEHAWRLLPGLRDCGGLRHASCRAWFALVLHNPRSVL